MMDLGTENWRQPSKPLWKPWPDILWPTQGHWGGASARGQVLTPTWPARMLAATVAALSAGASYAVVACTWAVSGQGLCWLLCNNLLSNVKSWRPDARGYAVGSLQSFFGMSAPIYISIWENEIFKSSALVPFLLFVIVWILCAVGVAVCCGGGNERLENAGVFDRTARRRFFRLQLAIAGLLLLIVSTALAQQTQWASYVIVAAAILGVPTLIFVFPDEASPVTTREEAANDRGLDDDDDDDATPKTLTSLGEPLLLENNPRTTKDDGATLTKEPLAAIGPRCVEFWEIFVIFAILTGGALATSNSMVAIARSVGTCEFAKLASFALTLSTAGDAFGRMLGGAAINAKAADGAVVMAVGALCLGAAHTAFSAAHGLALHQGPYSTGTSFLFLVAAGINGLADGCAWTACPWLTQARFGATRYGDNFGLVSRFGIFVSFSRSNLGRRRRRRRHHRLRQRRPAHRRRARRRRRHAPVLHPLQQHPPPLQ